MSAVISISTGKSYGVSRVCRIWGLSRASVYRDWQPAPPEPPGPRHDNGSQYISHDFQNEIAWLGGKFSPSFVRAPEGNGCAERFIRRQKENLLWVRTFDTIKEMQAALRKFKDEYNEKWLIQRHGHRSPNQFRRDDMDKIPDAA